MNDPQDKTTGPASEFLASRRPPEKPSPAFPATEGQKGGEPNRAFAVVATGVFLATTDSSMVNIALPAIMAHFHSSLRLTEWVVMAYLLAVTVSLLFWGNVADRLGRRRLYAVGLTVFGLGALACAQAGSLGALIGFRLVQATGAAMMMATGPAVIRENVPRPHLGRAFGQIGIAVSLGLMCGPSLGGVLLHFASWRSVFLVGAPVALPAAAAALLCIPPSRRYRVGQKIDVAGAVFWTLFVGVLFLTVSHASGPHPAPGRLIGGAALAVILLAVFLWVEARSAVPLLPLRLARQRFFWVALACAALSFVVLFSVTVLMPFYLDRVRALPSYAIGLLMLAIPAAAMVAAPVAGRLSDRWDARLLTAGGLATAGCGLVALAGIGLATPLAGVAVGLALVGGGQAVFLSPNSASVLRRVAGADAAVSAAMLATARNFGMLAGIALAGLAFSFFFSRQTGGLDLVEFTFRHRPAFVAALRQTFWCAATVAFASAVLALFRGPASR